MSLLRRPRETFTFYPASAGTVEFGNAPTIEPGDLAGVGTEVRGVFTRPLADATAIDGYSLANFGTLILPDPPGAPGGTRSLVVDPSGVVWEVDGDPIVRTARMRARRYVRLNLRRYGKV